DTSFSVQLAPSDPQVYQVFGVLCARGSLEHKTVQVALHGATYGHLYWDFPFQPPFYSYTRFATDAGYAVLAIDRIGIGRSDHPPSAAVDIAANAFVVHQIVQTLRGGDLVVPSFGRVRARRVALVGHSLGSAISIQEAATYGDVDGVVLTGVSHNVTPALGDVSFYPANLDPRFAGEGLDDGYITTTPGTRTIFYAGLFDPRILPVDEANKETVTLAELGTAVASLGFSSGVHAPVLSLVGDLDAAFCNPPSCTASGSLASEASFYPADACAEVHAIPETGHDLNLHLSAPLTFLAIQEWMDRRVGSDTRLLAPEPCRP
ncbi:MAG TPA: alpha/beta hydrolase, partial [Thermoanaerobaculia bacterium]